MGQTMLNSQDRCDRCGAQAYLRATVSGDAGFELLFCAHHARDHRERLAALGAEFHDETMNLDQSVTVVPES